MLIRDHIKSVNLKKTIPVHIICIILITLKSVAEARTAERQTFVVSEEKVTISSAKRVDMK